MANLPRLPPRAEHRLIKRLCGLAPSVQRRLFGRLPQIDGQTLATDIHVLLKLAELAGSPTFLTGMTVEAARASARYEATVIGANPPIPMARVEPVEVPGPAGPLGARLYAPLGIPDGVAPPLLVYYHGGGWVIGDLDTHDGVCRFLAATAGVTVLAVDYRLAPEHPFPAPVEDAWAAFAWAAANADSLGADPQRLAVAGDSAGGNLSAVVSLLAREGGGATTGDAVADLPGHRLGRDAPLARPVRRGLLPHPRRHGVVRERLPAGRRRRDRPADLDAQSSGPARPAARLRHHRRLRPAARRGRGLRAADARGRGEGGPAPPPRA